MSTVLPTDLHALLGCPASDERLAKLVGKAEPASIKVYSGAVLSQMSLCSPLMSGKFTDVTFYNYKDLGLSLQFKPVARYQPPRGAIARRTDLQQELLRLFTIDVYSDSYENFPIALTYPSPPDPKGNEADKNGESYSSMELSKNTTGEHLVQHLGEPDRKGGGESKSVGVWLEWTSLGLMCEFSSIHGAGRWDKANGAGSATVSIWSFFEPGHAVGEETDS